MSNHKDSQLEHDALNQLHSEQHAAKLEQAPEHEVSPALNSKHPSLKPELTTKPELATKPEPSDTATTEHSCAAESSSAAKPSPVAANHQRLAQQQWQGFEQVALEPVHENHYTQVNTESLIFTCVLLIVASLVIILPGDFYLAKVLGISVAAFIVISVVSYVRYQHAKSLAYAVCEHELIMQQGFWWVKRTSLPYSRLQHVSLSHGPLERHFNLATIKCFSAGSGSAEIELPGIEQQTAEQLRQHLLNQAAKANPTTSAQTDSNQTSITPEKDTITSQSEQPTLGNSDNDA
ncbi:PH domain-containing protein [Shewanella pneumatophori]|uniref:PH domain-containing protein n=1 Tax=Shewanella pneumatophori TaxID=314092 RepID=A0A9X2CC87_9GAMM|nr:PH domain-containing protein [Shewanella pneumatophori]MCL1137778.1 PH domain-containing protein [Shewanella pneumatophori]